MEFVSAPKVFFNWKPLLIKLGILVLVLSIPVILFFFRDQIRQKISSILKSTDVQLKPQIVQQGKVSEIATASDDNLFFASLEYDPNTGLVTQLKTGTFKAESTPLFPNLPQKLSPQEFAYKIEVLSEESEVLQSGWVVTFKKAIQTRKGTFAFGIAVPYRPNTFVKVYLPGNKLIWTGRIT